MCSLIQLVCMIREHTIFPEILVPLFICDVLTLAIGYYIGGLT